MRNDLEMIEMIENYLDNRLSTDDKAHFEREMAEDPSLQEKVVLQTHIRQGIERIVWKQQIRQAKMRSISGRNFRNWGSAGLIGILLVSLVMGILFYTWRAGHHPTSHIQPSHSQPVLSGYSATGEPQAGLPETNETGGREWADADKNLPVQQFSLDASRDTVIETRAGITMSIPAKAFMDGDGRTATGKTILIVKEALDPASIIKAGLSSRSGDQLLESGGMFFLDARQDGRTLKIDPAHAIYTEIPTNRFKPGMKLFTGRRLPDGTIDWVDPRALDHDLVPVDIRLLDLYPPHYLDSLAKWGYDRHDKRFTDSLYYSLAAMLTPTGERTGTGSKGDTALSPEQSLLEHFARYSCGINPASIKTIRSEQFQNTLLSTREFEERMPWIHRSGNRAILDLYVNNLDKRLSDIDSMAARLAETDSSGHGLRDQFLSFHARQDGKVKIGSAQFSKLKAYYEIKVRTLTEAITKTEHEFWNKQEELDDAAGTKRVIRQIDSGKSITQNFAQEFDLNLKSAWVQLGYDTLLPFRTPSQNVYGAMLTNTGWCNVDRAVYASTLNRATLDYTDPKSGKKAVIKYLPVSFMVQDPSKYDRIYLYLLPKKLSSFMRVSGSDGKYVEKLDELMRYDLVCIAYKNEQALFYSLEDVQAKDYPSFILSRTSDEELDRKLNFMGHAAQAADLKKENEFIRFDIGDQKRVRRNEELELLRYKLLQMIDPCFTRAFDAMPR